MCFSASVSFVSSGGLTVAGAASLKKAHKKEKIIAVIPLLFAIQQAFEGIQWLAPHPSFLELVAGYGFLFFAFLVWPVYVPIMVFLFDEKKRSILKWFVGLGILLALFFLSVLVTQPLTINVVESSIDYNFGIPLEPLMYGIYLVVVCGALMLSSMRVFRWYGGAVFIFALIAWTFFQTTFISVWCFFAALISASIYFSLKYFRK